ncbi:MAG: gamma-glutamylcyclotransferase [Candidatus Lambdaproteobacteria bacterium]|nr:gamma-glutamylcyclotransferase [Candidatus Lambdaproteobacteria bacterium]
MGHLLFVYGTLRAGSGTAVQRRLARTARARGAARFAGRLYDLGAYPGAVPDRSGRRWVHGELLELVEVRRTLAELDRYEGCTTAGAGAEFRRERVQVATAAGARRAWIYLYTRAVPPLREIPGGDYLRGRRRGR